MCRTVKPDPDLAVTILRMGQALAQLHKVVSQGGDLPEHEHAYYVATVKGLSAQMKEIELRAMAQFQGGV